MSELLDNFGITAVAAMLGIMFAYAYMTLWVAMRKRVSQHSERIHDLESEHQKELLAANDKYICQLKEEISRLQHEFERLKPERGEKT